MVRRLILRAFGLAHEGEAAATPEASPEAALGDVVAPGSNDAASGSSLAVGKPGDGLPEELSLVIAQATILFRPGRSDDDDGRLLVRVTGLGMWFWDGERDAADRVSRAYPELTRRACLKAARLIGGEVGRHNREKTRGERRNWVLDWDDPPAGPWPRQGGGW